MQILLDIDGVMVPANNWKQPEFHPDGFALFSIKAAKALKKIIDETQANLVLTTSHKANYSSAEWKDMFAARGIPVSKVDTVPENVSRLSRKDEVLNWILTCRHDPDFVIIDDDKSLNDLPSSLKVRLILTDGMIGLTETLAIKAIDLLRNSPDKVSA